MNCTITKTELTLNSYKLITLQIAFTNTITINTNDHKCQVHNHCTSYSHAFKFCLGLHLEVIEMCDVIIDPSKILFLSEM